MFTAEQYLEMIDHRKAQGARNLHVLTDPRAPETRLWFAYLSDIGMPYAFKLQHIRMGGSLTVPTQWPQDFDGGWSPHGPGLLVVDEGKRSSEMTAAEREAVLEKVEQIFDRAVGAGVIPGQKARRSPDLRDADRQKQVAAAEAVLREAGRAMPTLSPEALAKFRTGSVGEGRTKGEG